MAVDVTGAALGAIVRLLAKEITREAVASTAPANVRQWHTPLSLLAGK